MGKPLACQKCGAIILPAFHGLSTVLCEYCNGVVSRYGGGSSPERPVGRARGGRRGRLIAAVATLAALPVIGGVLIASRGGDDEPSEATAPTEPPAWEEGAPAEAVDPDIREALIDSPDAAEVERRLEAIDVSHCPGDFAVTFEVQVMPDGSAVISGVGPLESRSGARLSCLCAAIETLRFSPSRRGVTAGLELRGGALR